MGSQRRGGSVSSVQFTAAQTHALHKCPPHQITHTQIVQNFITTHAFYERNCFVQFFAPAPTRSAAIHLCHPTRPSLQYYVHKSSGTKGNQAFVFFCADTRWSEGVVEVQCSSSRPILLLLLWCALDLAGAGVSFRRETGDGLGLLSLYFTHVSFCFLYMIQRVL